MPEIDYFFEFQDQAAAFADPVVGPFLSDPLRSRTNIWAFDLVQNQPIAPPPPQPPLTRETFYWCMVGQAVPVTSLASHPKLKFVLTLPGPVLTMLTSGFRLDPGRALYAQNWALSAGPAYNFPPGFALTTVSGAALTDVNGDVLVGLVASS